MKSDDFLKMLFDNGAEDCGILAPPSDPQVALNALIHHFLGENWYSVNPISQKQVNTEAVCQILDSFPNKKKRWL